MAWVAVIPKRDRKLLNSPMDRMPLYSDSVPTSPPAEPLTYAGGGEQIREGDEAGAFFPPQPGRRLAEDLVDRPEGARAEALVDEVLEQPLAPLRVRELLALPGAVDPGARLHLGAAFFC